MKYYPSSQTIPSTIHERVLFGVWIIMSLLVLIAFGLQVLRHNVQLVSVLGAIGVGLVWCVPFGVAGFIFRIRRLRRVALRQKMMASLADLDT